MSGAKFPPASMRCKYHEAEFPCVECYQEKRPPSAKQCECGAWHQTEACPLCGYDARLVHDAVNLAQVMVLKGYITKEEFYQVHKMFYDRLQLVSDRARIEAVSDHEVQRELFEQRKAG
jgi:hypothetical protein